MHGVYILQKLGSQYGLSEPDVVVEARRIVVCKDLGETLLHKAARLGNEVHIFNSPSTLVLCVITFYFL